MTPVVIFGCGGLSAVVRDILLRAGGYEPVGYLTSDRTLHGRVIDQVTVLGGLADVVRLQRAGVNHCIVAIGDNLQRVEIAETLAGYGVQLVSAIHPLASVSRTAGIDPHVIIGARTIINTNACVGPHTVLSSGVIVEHDNRIGRGVLLHSATRLAGGVVVGDYATIGVGACVIPGRRIGQRAIVEPGTIVIRDVNPGDRIGGVPGRVVQSAVSRFAVIPDAPEVSGSAPASNELLCGQAD